MKAHVSSSMNTDNFEDNANVIVEHIRLHDCIHYYVKEPNKSRLVSVSDKVIPHCSTVFSFVFFSLDPNYHIYSSFFHSFIPTICPPWMAYHWALEEWYMFSFIKENQRCISLWGYSEKGSNSTTVLYCSSIFPSLKYSKCCATKITESKCSISTGAFEFRTIDVKTGITFAHNR